MKNLLIISPENTKYYSIYLKNKAWRYLYTLQTAWVSWQGFHEASNTITRLAPTKLIPNDPALVETRNKCKLELELNSLINFSLSIAVVEPSNPEINNDHNK